jgi:hypothetical protein
MPRFATADAVEALLDCARAFVDQRLELIVSEDVGPILLNPPRTNSPTQSGSMPVDTRYSIILRNSAPGPSVGGCSIGPANLRGTFRSEFMILVRMKPGHSTETPIPWGASLTRSPSERATTPYSVTVPPGRTDPLLSAQAKHAPSRCEPRSRATARRAAQ